MTVTLMSSSSRLDPATLQRARNRSRHYWALIFSRAGRARQRAARDYFAALVADQPDDVLVAAVEAVERAVGAPHREEV